MAGKTFLPHGKTSRFRCFQVEHRHNLSMFRLNLIDIEFDQGYFNFVQMRLIGHDLWSIFLEYFEFIVTASR